MTAAVHPTKIQLEDGERALARRRPDKTVYVGIVYFSGPRGGKYRPVRTSAQVNAEAAGKRVADIRGRRYRNNAFPTRHAVYSTDALGNVREIMEQS